jgi:hypothetical protein
MIARLIDCSVAGFEPMFVDILDLEGSTSLFNSAGML